ncbi:uncharacterized protein MKZ38_002993 [Zalerion maritima]|uniref:Integral membrane protein n=1 Tax=Zalerion maritima TaxID=339359 RepID=A0AAD5RPT8_9PEZI|nr:uncharacterized protein MKZ38_002993 [Zalerion maritima]
MSGPTTTIVPFASLPSCATNCGPLYDANGACVPPAAAEADETTYEQCFCDYSELQGLLNDPPSDVCNGACSGDSEGYTSIRDWFTSLRNEVATDTDSTATATSTSSSGGSSSSKGQDWLSSHWKWVVMIVVIFVGIVGIWVGACIWRRHYLKKKERMYEMGKHNAARTSGTGPWAPGSGVNVRYGDNVNPGPPNESAPPSNIPHPNAAVLNPPAFEEKQPKSKGKGKGKEKKKWVVKEHT